MGISTNSSPWCSFSVSFSLESSNISRSFWSLRWLDCSSFSRSSLLLLSSSLTMLMLSTNLSENCSPWGRESGLSEFPLRTLPSGSSEGIMRCCCEWCMLLMSSMCSLARASSSVSERTCWRRSETSRARGSSLTVGRLVMKEAFVAQVSVERFSQRKRSCGQRQASMRQQELPPMDCFRIEVSFESRQGTQALSPRFPFPPSARTVITCLSVNSDLLMSMLSFACRPSVPVNPIRSEPARSTSSILLARTLLGSKGSQLSMRILRIE